ncbi:MAG: adenine phosphoribosyltransferase [Solobacterium sp.]|nr:adenine phosphoribosyltransferase [Solobacterium sp.]
MKNTYTINVCGIRRELPLVPINETLAYASFVVIGDTEMVSHAGRLLAEKVSDAEVIMTAEAKGIALAYEVSRCLGMKEFIVARKSVKSYMRSFESVELESITTTGKQHLYLDEQDALKIRGKKICLVDDVISTGQSVEALERLALQAGGTVIHKAAILAEGEAAARDDLTYLQVLPLFEKNTDGNYREIVPEH